MPSILFINRVYPPDSGATGRVLEHMAHGFIRAGWQVTVLCTAGSSGAVGSYNSEGVRIVRVGGVFSKKSLLLRALGYACMIPSLFFRAVFMPRYDVVVTMTDPPMLLVVGPVLRLLKGSRLIHWAQDLYPEVAEELGVLSPGGAASRVLRFLATKAMNSHELTIALGRCMRNRLLARGIPDAKLLVVPNTGVEQNIVPVSRAAKGFRTLHCLGNSFIVQYSGNMGRAHEFETVIEVARILQEKGDTDILFLFVGEGPREAFVREEVRRLKLSNVRFLPSQPAEKLGESLGAGDLHFVTMREGMEGLVVPSKFYGVMAAGRPCLYVGPLESEVALVIQEQGTGIVMRPGDAAGLVTQILSYRDSPERVTKEGEIAREILRNQDAVSLFLSSSASLINEV